MALVLTASLIFLLLVGFEIWWRSHRIHNEFSRKFIHILVGSFVAFWPFYLSWRQIVIMSAAFVVVVAISKYFNVFQAIHAVERPTWGEIFFALAVGLLVFITHNQWIYAVAVLHMSLADGLAAVVGVSWGKSTRYTVLGHAKSLLGSAAFFVVSAVLLAGYYAIVPAPINVPVIASVAFIGSALENIGVAGLDNLLVPLVVALVLTNA